MASLMTKDTLRDKTSRVKNILMKALCQVQLAEKTVKTIDTLGLINKIIAKSNSSSLEACLVPIHSNRASKTR